MTDIEFKKQILVNEIKKCKAYVGAESLEAIENGYSDYVTVLTQVMDSLQIAINLLDKEME